MGSEMCIRDRYMASEIMSEDDSILCKVNQMVLQIRPDPNMDPEKMEIGLS